MPPCRANSKGRFYLSSPPIQRFLAAQKNSRDIFAVFIDCRSAWTLDAFMTEFITEFFGEPDVFDKKEIVSRDLCLCLYFSLVSNSPRRPVSVSCKSATHVRSSQSEPGAMTAKLGKGEIANKDFKKNSQIYCGCCANFKMKTMKSKQYSFESPY